MKAIIFSLIIAFIFSFLFFTFFLLYANPLIKNEKEFFSKIDNNSKVFLLGSSEIGQADPYFINEYLQKKNVNVTVYNLAITGDSPKKRIQNLDLILSSKPEIVIYGIGLRDFENTDSLDELPFNVQKFFHRIFSLEKIFPADYRSFEHPKRTLFLFFSTQLETIDNQTGYSPFYPQDVPALSIIRDDDAIKNQYYIYGGSWKVVKRIDIFSENANALALDEIVKIFKYNNIKFIILITPHDKFYLKELKQTEKIAFDVIIEQLRNDYKLPVYSLLENYTDKEIWTQPNHIAYNNNSTLIYSEDLAKIIVKEIER